MWNTEYDELNRPVRAIDSRGNEATTFYDPVGSIRQKIDVKGTVWNYSYTTHGLLEHLEATGAGEEATGYSADYSYDASGNLLEVQDSGNRINYTYDEMGQVTDINRLIDNRTASYSTAYTYTTAGRLTGFTYPEAASALNYDYDNLYRLEGIEGFTGEIKYDKNQSLESFTAANGVKTNYAYDVNNRLSSLVTSGSLDEILRQNFTYDASNNISSINDGVKDRSYDYDGKNQLTFADTPGTFLEDKNTDGRYGLVENDIRGDQGLENYINQQGEIDIDLFNTLVQVRYREAKSIRYIRIAPGRAADMLNSLAVNLYGAEDKTQPALLIDRSLWSWSEEDGAVTISLNSSVNVEVLKVDVNSDSVDPAFKPVNDAQLLDDLSKSLTLFDDAEEEQTSRIKEVKADYASSSIGVSFDGTAYVKIVEFVPDVLHQTHRIESRHLRLYSSADGAEYVPVPEEAYVYEKNEGSKITLTLNEILEAGIIKLHILFDDRDGELAPVDRAEFVAKLKNSLKIYQQSDSLKERYSYDKNGNRIRKTLEMQQLFITEPLYYEDSEWMLTDGVFAYTYDREGNTTAKGNFLEIGGLAYPVESEEAATFLKELAKDRTKEADLHFVENGDGVELWQYEYDLLNRLVSVRKENNTVADYGYDPDGLRTWKQTGGQRTHYLYHGNDVIFEKNISTGDVKSYVHAFGRHLTRIDGVVGDENAAVYTYVTDHLGSVRAVTDEAGALLWEGEYSPFGELITEKVIDVDFYDNHRFTGKMWDAEIGLYYFNARYYDPVNGRFVTEDPISSGLNWYIYASNNPLRFIDPTGLEDEYMITGVDNHEYLDTLYFMIKSRMIL